ncbi:helix-turn-helix domain-containing protein [Corynebacterium caspium]|uniref:helix-turn-helix domain-containing protein n=1 Tax=Corynebacterium caspium TaxID=234828 RepID=UPI000368BA67|nr:helix-turn-helix transcriptional regulator [Corynebacterium caspium]WKD59754.1 Helix-turn-helix protein [Corynebacterium caspium DSM 44850]
MSEVSKNFEAAHSESQALGGRAQIEQQWAGYGLIFAAQLRALREMRQLTQEELGELAGLSRNAISMMERNESTHAAPTNPSLLTIYKLSHALAVPPVVFLPEGGRIPGVAAPLSPVEEELSKVINPLNTDFYQAIPEMTFQMPKDLKPLLIMWPDPTTPSDVQSFTARSLRDFIQTYHTDISDTKQLVADAETSTKDPSTSSSR